MMKNIQIRVESAIIYSQGIGNFVFINQIAYLHGQNHNQSIKPGDIPHLQEITDIFLGVGGNYLF
jgi:hypothetical protein